MMTGVGVGVAGSDAPQWHWPVENSTADFQVSGNFSASESQ